MTYVPTELRTPQSILRNTRPIIRPRLIPMRPQAYHRLNRKRHARLRNPHRLILRIMRHTRRCVEQLIDPMTTVSRHNTTIPGLRLLGDYIARLLERHARLDNFYCFVEASAGGLDHADGVRICLCFIANIVGLVEVRVEAAVVEGDVDVDNVAVDEFALVGDAVADYFVDRSADGFGEFAVV